MDNGASSYRRFLDGDESAFNDIMEELFRGLVFFIDRYVHDIHAAEDIAIDTFSELIVHRHRYNFRATGFRKDQEYYICSGYRKGKDVCGETHSIRTVILEELILDNLREIVSFARQHKERFVQVVMDMDLKERNKVLSKRKKLLSDAEKRIKELDGIFKRLYEDNISGKLTDERFRKLSQDYENEQSALKDQVLLLREEVEAAESKSANVDRFLSIVDRYTEIPELTPHILREFVEKIVIHAATDPHSKVNRQQEVDIYYKGISILEMSKVYDTRQK